MHSDQKDQNSKPFQFYEFRSSHSSYISCSVCRFSDTTIGWQLHPVLNRHGKSLGRKGTDSKGDCTIELMYLSLARQWWSFSGNRNLRRSQHEGLTSDNSHYLCVKPQTRNFRLRWSPEPLNCRWGPGFRTTAFARSRGAAAPLCGVWVSPLSGLWP